jgi:aryl-alcohol dehydrogenase-like predicted oxidoreductase
MQMRKLGTSGLDVSAIGFGCMRMSTGHSPVAGSKKDMIAVMRGAVKLVSLVRGRRTPEGGAHY